MGAVLQWQVFSDERNTIAQPMRKSMTCNQGLEMAMHAKLTRFGVKKNCNSSIGTSQYVIEAVIAYA